MRTATISRRTTETEVSCTVNLDGSGGYDVKTGVGFFDHMMEQLARHSLIDITMSAKGDLHIDAHHTVEDCGIALGQAVAKATGDRGSIRRYASCDLPMDETLTRVAIDVSGRPFLVFNCSIPRDKISEFDTELVREWFEPSPRMPGSPCTSKTPPAATPTSRDRASGIGAILARHIGN